MARKCDITLRGSVVEDFSGYQLMVVNKFVSTNCSAANTDPDHVEVDFAEDGSVEYKVFFCGKYWTLKSLDSQPVTGPPGVDYYIYYVVNKARNTWDPAGVIFDKTEAQAKLIARDYVV